eukprot:TRINITY_DN21986_c0_g1_i1.p1 TRINITY_DN21986_c0_g1~~TRINITY_DN21986_c0_g1_i1.p1  ORF type:complete len:379 (-),score=35.97 TRINITY_DN21986_c0_g1_i1:352-1488(-)
MVEVELAKAVEIIPERFYWVSLSEPPADSSKTLYVSIESMISYQPLAYDFGPPSIAVVYRYCLNMTSWLCSQLAGKRVVNYCSNDPSVRTNAVFLVCAYQIIVLCTPPEVAFGCFRNLEPPLLTYSDASSKPSDFQLSILDYLKGLASAIRNNWFNMNSFDESAYRFLDDVDNGDMNWIIPGKFLTFGSPAASANCEFSRMSLIPERLVNTFHKERVRSVIRLSSPEYESSRFSDYGINHVDLFFAEGTCPSQTVVDKFLRIAENEPGAVAVHSKAGLGRSTTLIGLYAMKHYRISARDYIAWCRLCRPGSVLGRQQQYLCDMQRGMFLAAAVLKAQALQDLQTWKWSVQSAKKTLNPAAEEDTRWCCYESARASVHG